jgi:hypothetical protein
VPRPILLAILRRRHTRLNLAPSRERHTPQQQATQVKISQSKARCKLLCPRPGHINRRLWRARFLL